MLVPANSYLAVFEEQTLKLVILSYKYFLSLRSLVFKLKTKQKTVSVSEETKSRFFRKRLHEIRNKDMKSNFSESGTKMRTTLMKEISLSFDETKGSRWSCDLDKPTVSCSPRWFKSTFKGPRTYLARVSKEVKFHFRSTEFPQ